MAEKCHGRDPPRQCDESGSAVLEALGLDEAHTMVYRSVLGVPAATAKEVAADLGMPASRVRRIIEELEQLGLLARQASHSDRLVASPPAIALKPLLLDRERGLTRANEALHELSELYRKSAEHRNRVFEVMKEEMKYDRSKYTILPISKFGLMQITRQRVRPGHDARPRY